MEKGQPFIADGTAAGNDQDWSSAARQAMGLVISTMSRAHEEQRFKLVTEFMGELRAFESRLVAQRVDKGTSDRRLSDLLGDADKRSRQEKKKTLRRGKAVNENPELADKMRDGTLSTEQADLISEASEKTEGDAATDTELIDKIAAQNPDQGKKTVEDYLREREDQDALDDKYKRARRLRNVRRFSNPRRGTDVLEIESAPTDIDEIERAFEKTANRLYKEDGGRDVPNDEHPRTYQQRRFDAIHQLITSGNADEPSGTVGKAGGGRSKRSDRAVVFIKATLDQVTGADMAPLEIIGSRPLPRPVLQRLMCEAEFIGQIFDGDGEILHHGRRKRRATPQQFEALVSRDRGCVQCGAHWSRCEVHHVLPWNAPIAGEGDIENMVLLCSDCHHRVHELELTIERDVENQTWRSRKARPEEIAPKKPNINSKPRPNIRV